MIETTLRSLILSDPTVSALLGSATAVYPQQLPQGASKPCVVYSVHDGIQRLLHGERSRIKMYMVTLKVFSEGYGACRQVTEALVDLLNGYAAVSSGDVLASVRVNNVFSDYEDTLELYTSIVDVTIHLTE